MFNKLNIYTTVMYPDFICNSIYSNYVASKDKRVPYNNYSDIIKEIKKITTDNEETFTYLYLPEIDNLEHDNSVHAPVVKQELLKIETMIEKITSIKDLTIIVTADHGQINIENDVIMEFKKYNKYFYAMPGIDFATTTFYVKEDMQSEFEEEFKKDFTGRMFLFKTNIFYEKNIFGLEKSNKYFENNMGEYIGICKNGYCFVNAENLDEYLGKIKGNHSRFSKDEMTIPLIIINSNEW